MSKSHLGGGLATLSQRQDIALVILLLMAIMMIIIPLPTVIVDTLIAINLTCSIILLMVSLYLREPLEFSSFPSVLLITTIFRLALNISTSRLILLQHDAGEIVYTFGQFAVSGNLTVGIVIFSIITIVQFIVITKGSERVAEVSARFSLDGMPGKQMSIDGDMRAGTIDANEARRLRQIVQKESQLYGAMDGAMKFVKGDAIAGIIVTLVNIIGGIAVGVLMHGMSASEATTTYSILSIGDGLVSQIPSLLISVTAGIIVTRIPGEQRKNLATDLSDQLGKYPQALVIAAAVLVIFALIPGFPTFTFLVIAGLIVFANWKFLRTKKDGSINSGNAVKAQSGNAQGTDTQTNITPGAVPLKLTLAPNLSYLLNQTLMTQIDQLRQEKFEYLGIPLSDIPVEIDNRLAENTFKILLYQEPIVSLTLSQQAALVDAKTPNIQIQNIPIFHQELLTANHTPLYWIEKSNITALALLNIRAYENEAILIHCLAMVIERYASEFIGVQETRYLMDAMETRYGELVKELQRQLSVGKISSILQRLVEENISIRNLRSIFEALIEWGPKEKDIVVLTEYARLGLRRHIVERYRHNQRWIQGWMLGAMIENKMREAIRQTSAGSYLALPPEENKAILQSIAAHLSADAPHGCVLLATMDIRRFVRKLIEPEFFHIPVLSYQEIGDEAQLNILGNIELMSDYEQQYLE